MQETEQIDGWVHWIIELKDMFHLSHQSQIISRSAEREREMQLQSAYQWDGGTVRHNVESSGKKRKKGLSRALIGEGVNIDEEQDWAQNTALIFHWEKGRGEDFN